MPLSLAENAISWEGLRGRGRVLALVVAFFEGTDADGAVLPKPLNLNPASTEDQVLINEEAGNIGTSYGFWLRYRTIE